MKVVVLIFIPFLILKPELLTFLFSNGQSLRNEPRFPFLFILFRFE